MKHDYVRSLGLFTIALLLMSLLPAVSSAGPSTLPGPTAEPAGTVNWTEQITLSTGAVSATASPYAALSSTTLPSAESVPLDPDAPGGQLYSLRGTLTVNRTLADPGHILTYTLILTNSGEAVLDMTVNDRIPPATTYIAGSVTGATFVPDPPPSGPNMGVITWNGPLATGASRTIRFRVRVRDTAIPGTAIVNGPEITAPQLELDLSVTTVISGGHALYMPLILLSR